MTHHTLIAMFGTGAARSHLHVDLITSVKSREKDLNIPALGGVLMRTLFQFASEFIFGEMTTLLLF